MDAEAFADNVVKLILTSKRVDGPELATANLFGTFTNAFIAKCWDDALLRKVKAHVVLAAAQASRTEMGRPLL